MTKYIFVIFFVLVFYNVFAQNNNSLFISDKIYSGYVVNNYLGYDSFPKLKPALINEFTVGYKTLGSKSWHQFYKYPEISASVFAGNVGNKRQFGQVLGFVPQVGFDLKKYDNSFLKINFGMGVSYYTKPYDSVTNPHNILVGSHITTTALISLIYQKRIIENTYFTISGAYIHSSNGHYQVPNGGLNLATVSIGVKKYFSDIDKTQIKYRPEKPDKTDIYVNFGYGIHEFAGSLRPVGTPKYNIYNFSVYFSRNYSFIGKYFIGFYAKYYESFNHFIVKNKVYEKNIILNSSVLTLDIGNEFQFGRFSIFTNGGLNFYMPFVVNFIYKDEYKFNIDNIFELLFSARLGMRYYLLNPQTSNFNIYLAWAIKANFGNADFNEFSIGFVF